MQSCSAAIAWLSDMFNLEIGLGIFFKALPKHLQLKY
jgi:hypothetical protein